MIATDDVMMWMIRKDMPSVLAIEEASFEFPWTAGDFHDVLSQRNSIGMVYKRGEQVVAYMIYLLEKETIHLLSFAVDPHFRREGIGRSMLTKLKGKLSVMKRREIIAMTRETNLDAHLFLKRQGFTAVEIVGGYYVDTPEDAYRFSYLLDD